MFLSIKLIRTTLVWGLKGWASLWVHGWLFHYSAVTTDRFCPKTCKSHPHTKMICLLELTWSSRKWSVHCLSSNLNIVQNNHVLFLFEFFSVLAFSCSNWDSSTLGSGSLMSFNGTLCSYNKIMELNKTMWVLICTSRTRLHFRENHRVEHSRESHPPG